MVSSPEEDEVADSGGGADKSRPIEGKKSYRAPTLTEYGSVAKLTMTKGSTQVESPSSKLKNGTCL